MESFSFLPFLLIILAILIGLGGLTFLIIGLVQSKKVFWISGSVGLITSLVVIIIGITSFVSPLMTNISNGIKKYDLKNRHFNNEFSNSPEYLDNPVDTSYADVISGFIVDNENSPVYIRVFPKREFVALGVIIDRVDKGMKSKNVPKDISLAVHFDKAFTGNLLMTAYNNENKELSKSEVSIEKKAGDNCSLDFAFSGEINLSDIKFCTLSLN